MHRWLNVYKEMEGRRTGGETDGQMERRTELRMWSLGEVFRDRPMIQYGECFRKIRRRSLSGLEEVERK